MESIELKKIIAGLLEEGKTLDEVQKALDSEHNEKMTFFELKMLAAELEDFDWGAQEEEEPVEEPEESPDGKPNPEGPTGQPGATVVEVSKLTRPGIALSGSVKFASGASADWVLDQQGRLAFEKSEGEPTQDDLKEFQEELRAQLGR
ncbi:MAG: hypothetical protein KAG97_11190 [Victivallales bacterium]|nr:hypothetical protein [Victivallales bacterium]